MTETSGKGGRTVSDEVAIGSSGWSDEMATVERSGELILALRRKAEEGGDGAIGDAKVTARLDTRGGDVDGSEETFRFLERREAWEGPGAAETWTSAEEEISV